MLSLRTRWSRNCLVIFTAASLMGCGGPKSTVQGFMDAALKKEDVSRYCAQGFKPSEVTDYEFSAYSIENITGELVSVKITFRTKGGNDRAETKKFHVKNGKIISIE